VHAFEPRQGNSFNIDVQLSTLGEASVAKGAALFAAHASNLPYYNSSQSYGFETTIKYERKAHDVKPEECYDDNDGETWFDAIDWLVCRGHTTTDGYYVERERFMDVKDFDPNRPWSHTWKETIYISNHDNTNSKLTITTDTVPESCKGYEVEFQMKDVPPEKLEKVGDEYRANYNIWIKITGRRLHWGVTSDFKNQHENYVVSRSGSQNLDLEFPATKCDTITLGTILETQKEDPAYQGTMVTNTVAKKTHTAVKSRKRKRSDW